MKQGRCAYSYLTYYDFGFKDNISYEQIDVQGLHMPGNLNMQSISATVFRPEDGKLYIFTPNRIEILRSWPYITAFRKTKRKPRWVHFRPKIALPAKDVEKRIRCLEENEDEYGQKYLFFPHELVRARRQELAWLKWYSTIPRGPCYLTKGFSARQWHMLAFLSHCGNAASDLTVSNPALAWALASNQVFHRPAVQQPLRAASSMLKKKQRDILGWLGFPPTEAARKIVAKIIPRSVGINDLLALRRAMERADFLKKASHLEYINKGVIRAAADPELFPYASYSLLDEISRCQKEDAKAEAAYLLKDSLEILAAWFPKRKKLPPLKSLSMLKDIHDDLLGQVARIWPYGECPKFPPPPVEGTDTIHPITSVADLLEEGRIMNNCAELYAGLIAIERWFYFYRIIHPERCTLALIRDNNEWVLWELKAACNKPASEASMLAVKRWLASNSNLGFLHRMESSG